jgi:hypothetical protein
MLATQLLECRDSVPKLRAIVRTTLAAAVKADDQAIPPELRLVARRQQHAARQAAQGLLEPRRVQRQEPPRPARLSPIPPRQRATPATATPAISPGAKRIPRMLRELSTQVGTIGLLIAVIRTAFYPFRLRKLDLDRAKTFTLDLVHIGTADPSKPWWQGGMSGTLHVHDFARPDQADEIVEIVDTYECRTP